MADDRREARLSGAGWLAVVVLVAFLGVAIWYGILWHRGAGER